MDEESRRKIQIERIRLALDVLRIEHATGRKNAVVTNGLPKAALQATGFHNDTVRAWHIGKRVPDANDLATLARFSGRSVDWILGLPAPERLDADAIDRAYVAIHDAIAKRPGTHPRVRAEFQVAPTRLFRRVAMILAAYVNARSRRARRKDAERAKTRIDLERLRCRIVEDYRDTARYGEPERTELMLVAKAALERLAVDGVDVRDVAIDYEAAAGALMARIASSERIRQQLTAIVAGLPAQAVESSAE